MKRVFSLNQDEVSQFWWVEVNGSDLVVSHRGPEEAVLSEVHFFETEEECLAEAEALIGQAVDEGYLESAGFNFEEQLYFDDPEIGPNLLTSHPKFRANFAHDIYYSCIDEEAPFGSDEGADVLSDLEVEMRSNESLDIISFPQQMMEEAWELVYVKPLKVNKDELRQQLDEHGDYAVICTNMVVYATAFGQIKISGAVDPELKRLALIALENNQVYAELGDFLDEESAEMLGMMAKDLAAFE